MEMETLLGLAVALSAGLLMSRVVKPFKLPAVTGYLIAGYKTVCMGFPIEALKNDEDINTIIRKTLEYFKR